MKADPAAPQTTCLIVVPCLNEEAFIGPLLDFLSAEAREVNATIVVVDGGSSDRTRAIVSEKALGNPAIRLCDNPLRIQSAGVNRAVERFGADAAFLIRIDAHAHYPDGYCRTLVAEAERTGASSVVVSMRTVARHGFQAAVAIAQSGRIGTGGSSHRSAPVGRWVDHGHHALIRVDAFKGVGGYDETFSHNEDAELDHRLHKAGGRVWMTAETDMTYYPRATAGGLFRQYFGYGKGRARNMLKHRTPPKLRQALPMLVAPALVLALLSPLSLLFAVPAAAWVAACLLGGLAGFARTRKVEALLAGVAAMIMHLGWSLGFWAQLASPPRPREIRA
ncbi:glycosyltransferase family 2 protein [Aureimonas populi]|uniref:Glycosyltransferase family 2 protein n=1 Tax=Aureimonas populi TaxID=1701758 RepID=A0ABW5CRS2_9HYPH|nr:glycosyltransferase family 2 protein [Aureimonas populi]